MNLQIFDLLQRGIIGRPSIHRICKPAYCSSSKSLSFIYRYLRDSSMPSKLRKIHTNVPLKIYDVLVEIAFDKKVSVAEIVQDILLNHFTSESEKSLISKSDHYSQIEERIQQLETKILKLETFVTEKILVLEEKPKKSLPSKIIEHQKVICPKCGSGNKSRWGYTNQQEQRWKCWDCGWLF